MQNCHTPKPEVRTDHDLLSAPFRTKSSPAQPDPAARHRDRGQVGLDAGQPLDRFARGPVGLGDGWLRLLEFNLAAATPWVVVRTYSTHYRKLSSELATYAGWYREHEQPEMSDDEFLAEEAFELELVDFRERFGVPRAH